MRLVEAEGFWPWEPKTLKPCVTDTVTTPSSPGHLTTERVGVPAAPHTWSVLVTRANTYVHIK